MAHLGISSSDQKVIPTLLSRIKRTTQNFSRFHLSVHAWQANKKTRALNKRVLNRFFGTRDFPYLELGIRDLKAKSRRVLGLKV